MGDLQTTDASEITMESVAERFETLVMKGEAFTPDVAIHYIELEKEGTLLPGQELLAAVEKAKACQLSADMMADEEKTTEQMWTILCTPPTGQDFAKSFVEFTRNNKENLRNKNFTSLITCLDKTDEIINSILNPNGTQHT